MSNEAVHLQLGDTLEHNRYQVLRQLGVGGMGAVYEVFDARLQTKMALKSCSIQTAAAHEQFSREARLLAKLSHPALPRVTDHFADRGGVFLVMELITGDDLSVLLARQGKPFATEQVLGWADQVLDALEYLHTRQPPVIHRDIKPQNLKLDTDERIRLLDFGIARQMDAGSHTTAAARAISIRYSPIEQFSDRLSTDTRSDIYALGATLYHLLTGQPPLSAPERAGGVTLPDITALNVACPPQLALIIQQAMNIQPEQRFQSANAFRRALQNIRRVALETVPNVASEIQTLPTAPSQPQRRSATTTAPIIQPTKMASLLPFAAGMFVLLALVGGAVIGTQLLDSNQPATTPIQVSLAEPTQPVSTLTASDGLVLGTSPSPTLPVANILPPSIISASGFSPPAVDSSGATVTFRPELASDGQPETAWRVPGDGVGAWLQIDLATMALISEVRLIPGYAKIDAYDSTNRFVQNRRVRRVRFEFSDGSSREASFADQDTLQPTLFEPPVSSNFVRIIILETLPPAVSNGRDFTPISEVTILGTPAINSP